MVTPTQNGRCRQLTSSSIQSLCGIQLSHTTAHHPAANGLVECFHRTLKVAIMCHADQQWAEVLPLVLLWFHNAFTVEASVAEFVYSKPSSIPGKLLNPATDPTDPAHLTTALPAHVLPSASPSSTPRLPSYFRAQFPIRTTCSGRHIRFPARFNSWATISAGGGGWCGNYPHSSKCENTSIIAEQWRVNSGY
jgi:hypothetical protein